MKLPGVRFLVSVISHRLNYCSEESINHLPVIVGIHCYSVDVFDSGSWLVWLYNCTLVQLYILASVVVQCGRRLRSWLYSRRTYSIFPSSWTPRLCRQRCPSPLDAGRIGASAPKARVIFSCLRRTEELNLPSRKFTCRPQRSARFAVFLSSALRHTRTHMPSGKRKRALRRATAVWACLPRQILTKFVFPLPILKMCV